MTPRLLIADDDAALRRLLRILLERDGRFDVVGEAVDGVEALELTEKHDPDVLLLDLAMPRLDGIGVLEQLHGRTRPVVAVLTGFIEETLCRQVLDAGAVACLEKGPDFASLGDQILACLSETSFERSPSDS